jgi:RND family efflux transporter MFP subunit
VEVAAVQRAPVTVWVDTSGTLEPDEKVQVSARVMGRVKSVEHDLGDRVADGEVLARIDDTDYLIALNQKKMAVAEALAELGLTEPPPPGFDVSVVPRVKAARAQAANAAAKRDRIADLMKKDPSAFSRQDFEDIKTAADVASANADVAALDAGTLVATVQTRLADVAKAQRDLDETVLMAPRPARAKGSAAGYGVSARSVSVGDLVAVGSTMYTLVEDNPLKFTARVPERFMGQVKPGQRVEVSLEALAGKPVGTVRRVSPVVDAESRMFQVQVEVPNDAGTLKPGAFARARIAVGEHPASVFVPNEALVVFAGVRKVFSVKDGKAVEHLVQLGERRETTTEVVSGLEGVERVVVKGGSRLTRGTPVTVK